jgi:DNA-binding LytR/AlgR family response regulator
VKIAIVEDEAIVARRLERMVRAISGSSDVAIASTFESALVLIRSRPIDLLFLDLNLNGRDGFELLEEAAAAPFQTVVVSAHHEQALRAFEYGVIDFIAKPWSEERLRLAFERTTTREPQRRATTIVVRKGRELRSVAANDIVFIQGADDYSELHLADRSVHLHEKTLNALEALLPQNFLRVHRSYIANLSRVRGMRASSLVMKDDTLVPVGRVYRDAVRAKLLSSS